jgi:hypothetical protein
MNKQLCAYCKKEWEATELKTHLQKCREDKRNRVRQFAEHELDLSDFDDIHPDFDTEVEDDSHQGGKNYRFTQEENEDQDRRGAD